MFLYILFLTEKCKSRFPPLFQPLLEFVHAVLHHFCGELITNFLNLGSEILEVSSLLPADQKMVEKEKRQMEKVVEISRERKEHL